MIGSVPGPPLFAYLDPGSGALLLQAFLGGGAAIGVLLRLYGRRAAAAFRRVLRRAP